MRKIFLFLILSGCFSVFSQSYEWAFTTAQNSNVIALDVDTAENIVVIQTYQVAQFIYGNKVVRYDSNRNLEWSQNIEGRLLENGSLATDPQGNVYYTAQFQNTLSVNNTTYSASGTGRFSMVLIKFNSSGAFQWLRHTTGTDAFGSGLAVDKQNKSIYVFGGVGYDGNAVLDTCTLSLGLFVAKFNFSGNIQWARSISNGAKAPSGANIKVSNTGDVFIGGYLSGLIHFGTYTISSFGDSDNFLAKIDSTGNWHWVRHGGGDGQDEFFGMDIDNNDNVYVTGYLGSSTATFGTVSLQNCSQNYFLAKYDSDGSVKWAVDDGASAAFANSFCVDADGNSYMVGGGNFIRKHDSSGILSWTDQKTATNVRMISDKKRNVYIGGHFSGNATFGNTTLNTSQPSQMFVAKLNDGSTINSISENTLSHNFEMYPNPAKYNVVIKCSDFKKGDLIRVTNSTGQTVLLEEISNSSIIGNEINTGHLAKGLYLVEVVNHENQNRIIAKKLVVE
jgi:hypothetical protein